MIAVMNFLIMINLKMRMTGSECVHACTCVYMRVRVDKDMATENEDVAAIKIGEK